MILERESPCRYPDEPIGTRSQVWRIMNGMERVALVHLYRRPDGTLGASGLPDPKIVVHNGVTYCLARQSSKH